MSDVIPVKRALISVSDKTDLVAFARRLIHHGVKIISTGGTSRALKDSGLAVTTVDEVTGFPEILDGRVKTLHPKIHGGLLGRRDVASHVEQMATHGIEPIELVCVNLYPFEKTIAQPSVAEAEAIEQIDIGGPGMVRSAAKNHTSVAVVTDPSQYDHVIAELDSNVGGTTLSLRRWLAAAAFARTAAYDTAIAGWMSRVVGQTPGEARFPDALVLRFNRLMELRYGENPHQRGALYIDSRSTEAGVAHARQRHGKALSFCNLYDANGALELVKEVDASEHAAAAVIKHANPCGFALAADLPTAFDHAYEGDPLAAFGGIVALNRAVDVATAKRIVDGQKFLEVILAPEFEDDAAELIGERWKNVRLMEVGALPRPEKRDVDEMDYKRVTGGLLVQQRDLSAMSAGEWSHVAGPAPSEGDLHELRIAMMAVKHLKSNAVCLVRDGMLVGAGAGQMDRVASCRLAVEKAGERAKGAYVGSDAFFPFRDGPDLLIGAGVKAIAQPGGSKRDEETIEACEGAGVTLVFTGQRHFRH